MRKMKKKLEWTDELVQCTVQIDRYAVQKWDNRFKLPGDMIKPPELSKQWVVKITPVLGLPFSFTLKKEDHSLFKVWLKDVISNRIKFKERGMA